LHQACRRADIVGQNSARLPPRRYGFGWDTEEGSIGSWSICRSRVTAPNGHACWIAQALGSMAQALWRIAQSLCDARSTVIDRVVSVADETCAISPSSARWYRATYARTTGIGSRELENSTAPCSVVYKIWLMAGSLDHCRCAAGIAMSRHR